ncbi:hypothetical protein GCM10008955_00360 [Deinococcus malanensis]|uniref:Uncharacterized protein n=1 Tax=Deinococcus malanensis TaxID=1706855 RepID=A0ABQ2EKE1_9DEIO|nr:hypothetical protein GCM10008955_00360 [Deinococcus malanensis]
MLNPPCDLPDGLDGEVPQIKKNLLAPVGAFHVIRLDSQGETGQETNSVSGRDDMMLMGLEQVSDIGSHLFRRD